MGWGGGVVSEHWKKDKIQAHTHTQKGRGDGGMGMGGMEQAGSIWGGTTLMNFT